MKALEMEAEPEGEDFNNAMDKIFDIFSDDLQEYSVEDEELLRAQETYDRLTADARENNTRSTNMELTSSIPKILKNDIRRYYSRMFMNTLNSADFINLQDYYNTFMAGPCNFVAEHGVRPEFAIPNVVVTKGPIIMAHYTLGCFVMYPDMVVTMKDSRIVTSNCWTGSKIVMDIEIRATKMYDIDLESWVPQVANLAESYRAAEEECALMTAAMSNATLVTAYTPQPSTYTTKAAAPAMAQSTTKIAASEASSRTTRSSECPSVTQLRHRPGKSECNSDNAALAVISTRSTNKRKFSTAVAVADDSSTITNASTGASSITSCENDGKHSYIPDAYIRSLSARAKLLPKPIPLLLQGQITMFLDESNHIQHMSQKTVQKTIGH